MPHVPAEDHGRPVLILAAVHGGEPTEGERALQPLRELARPLTDLSAQLPYTALQSAFDPFFPYGQLRYYWKSINIDPLSEDTNEAIVSRAAGRPTPQALIALWHFSGAMNAGAAAETAFAGRTAPFLHSLDTTWTDPADDEHCIAWTRQFWSEMQPYSPGGLYLNFGGFGEEKDELVKSAFGDNYERLVAVKNAYDLTNLFRIDQNIRLAV